MVYNISPTANMISSIYRNQYPRFYPEGNHTINSTIGYANAVNVTLNLSNQNNTNISLRIQHSGGFTSYVNMTDKIKQNFSISLSTDINLSMRYISNNYSSWSPILKNTIILETYNISTGDTTPPAVTLNSPPEAYYNDTLSNTYFNCTSIDTSGVANISLYLTNKLNSSFALNLTNTTSETLNTMNATYNLSIGNYTWNCESCDVGGYCDFAINRTVEMRPLYTPPTDTCTCPVSGNWNVDCIDNCSVNADCNIGTNNLYINGNIGSFTINEDLHLNDIWWEKGCKIWSLPNKLHKS